MGTNLLLYFFTKLPPPAMSNLDGSTLAQPHPQPLHPSALGALCAHSRPTAAAVGKAGGEITVTVPISQIRKLSLRDVILYLPKATGSLVPIHPVLMTFPSAEDTGIQRNSEGPHQPSIHTEMLFQEWGQVCREWSTGPAKAPGLFAWDRRQHPGSGSGALSQEGTVQGPRLGQQQSPHSLK